MPKALSSFAVLAVFAAAEEQPRGVRTYSVESSSGKDANEGLSARAS